MGLEADAVDRHATGPEVPDDVVDAGRLRVDPVGVVVVVAELCAGIGRAGGAERRFDPVVAGALQVRVAPAAAAAVGERLVHHVPGVDLPTEVGGHLGDVVDGGVAQVTAGQALCPSGLLGVPQQGVSTYRHALGSGVADDAVTGAVVEPAPLRLGRVRLHLVLGDEAVELAVQHGHVRVVVELVGPDGGAEVAAFLRRRGTQCGGCVAAPAGTSTMPAASNPVASAGSIARVRHRRRGEPLECTRSSMCQHLPKVESRRRLALTSPAGSGCSPGATGDKRTLRVDGPEIATKLQGTQEAPAYDAMEIYVLRGCRGVVHQCRHHPAWMMLER